MDGWMDGKKGRVVYMEHGIIVLILSFAVISMPFVSLHLNYIPDFADHEPPCGKQL
jgi:hypothetical protein